MHRLKTQRVKLGENNYQDIIIKNHANNNDYFLNKDNLWIRNFGKRNCVAEDINNLYEKSEIEILLQNEVNNQKSKYIDLFSENITNKKVLIISDGFGYSSQNYWIDNIPSDVKIICVHGSLRFWKNQRLPDYYVFTNPFENSMIYYPEMYFPFMIASTRSNHKFVSRYQNNVYVYNTTPDQYYESSLSHNSSNYIDEYRNAVAAAINLAYFMNAEKICLAYPIDAYKEERSATIKMGSAFVYPQQIMSSNIIDAMLFWYKFNKPSSKIFYCGIENLFHYAKYVKEESIFRFFDE